MATNPFITQQQQLPAELNQPVESAQIMRQRRLAEQLLADSQKPLDGQVVGGRYIAPHWTQGLAKIASGYVAGKKLEEADTQTANLQTKLRDQRATDMEALVKALKGTPGQAAQGAPASATMGVGLGGVEGVPASNPALAGTPIGGVPSVQLADTSVAATPGSGPDYMGAAKVGLRSSDPAVQQMAQQLMLKNVLPREQKWEKVDLPDEKGNKRVGWVDINSTAPEQTFRQGGKEPLKGIVAEGRLINPVTGEAIGQGIPNPNKPFNPDGSPNAAYQQYEMSKARSGAANVNVNTANKPFLSEIGKGVGESVVNAYGGAQSAVQTLNNVEQIRKGLNSAILGPGAGARVKLSQVGQVLGIGGKDAAEQLQNTRSVMQGLARQELAAAGSMKGQGQITESERGILRRAEAGDISEMTRPEVETLLQALDKTSRYRIGLHQANLDKLKRDPNAAGVADYMSVQAPSPAASTRPSPAVGGAKFLGFE